jgi:hypothetical protein
MARLKHIDDDQAALCQRLQLCNPAGSTRR